MLDPVCESGCNKALLDDGMVFDGTLVICLQKLQLLGDVRAFLVVLAVLVDISEESPVIEVIDSILEDGICCLVTPEVTTEPGRQQFHWFVR